MALIWKRFRTSSTLGLGLKVQRMPSRSGHVANLGGSGRQHCQGDSNYASLLRQLNLCYCMTTKLAKKLDGCYIRMLRTILNVSWKQHLTNPELLRISDKIRRMHFAGHCVRSEEPVANLVHWTPKHGKRKPGRPALTFIDVLKQSTGLHIADLGQQCRTGRYGMPSCFEYTTRIKQVSKLRKWVM